MKAILKSKELALVIVVFLAVIFYFSLSSLAEKNSPNLLGQSIEIIDLVYEGEKKSPAEIKVIEKIEMLKNGGIPIVASSFFASACNKNGGEPKYILLVPNADFDPAIAAFNLFEEMTHAVYCFESSEIKGTKEEAVNEEIRASFVTMKFYERLKAKGIQFHPINNEESEMIKVGEEMYTLFLKDKEAFRNFVKKRALEEYSSDSPLSLSD